MSTNPKFESDGSEEFDDFDDLIETSDDDVDIEDVFPRREGRSLAAWRKIEHQISERQLRSELDDWDYWDDYLTVH